MTACVKKVDPCLPQPGVRSMLDGRCPICAEALTEKVWTCPRCATPHHLECHDYAGACAVYGCDPAVPLRSADLLRLLDRLEPLERYQFAHEARTLLGRFLVFIPLLIGTITWAGWGSLALGQVWALPIAWTMFAMVYLLVRVMEEILARSVTDLPGVDRPAAPAPQSRALHRDVMVDSIGNWRLVKGMVPLGLCGLALVAPRLGLPVNPAALVGIGAVSGAFLAVSSMLRRSRNIAKVRIASALLPASQCLAPSGSGSCRRRDDPRSGNARPGGAWPLDPLPFH